jgi:aryl-alcohol dehydrogenase-like predicted oxidoreductase
MIYNALGSSDLKVSRLCFGGLTISPLQASLSPEKGAEIIAYGVEKGINFLDTAELYGLYPTLKATFQLIKRQSLVLSTKAYCHDKETAMSSVEKALQAMGTDYIDIFMLHEQESEHTLRGHEEAVKQLIRYKEQGLIKAIGLSTHYVAGVKAATRSEDMQVIHPIYNSAGIGIVDGSALDMLSAIEMAYKSGKGIYAMKILAGGHLIKQAKGEIQKALAMPVLHSIAIGMKSKEEIDVNVALFEQQTVSQERLEGLQSDRHLWIHDWCTGCGACVHKCAQKALSLKNGTAQVHHEACVLCGYCAAVCPEFCIKVI